MARDKKEFAIEILNQKIETAQHNADQHSEGNIFHDYVAEYKIALEVVENHYQPKVANLIRKTIKRKLNRKPLFQAYNVFNMK